MAKNVTDWAWKHSRAVNGSLIVLLAIAHEANSGGEAEMGISELTGKCRLSERTVQAALRDLVGCGELEVSHGGGRGHRMRQRVTMRNPADSAGFEPGNPAESAPFTGNPAESAPFTEPGNPAESAPFTGHNGRSGHSPPVNPAKSAGFEISDVLKTTTGSCKVQVRDVPAKPERPDVERLCAHLADRIAANGSRRPAIGKKWRDAARLMLDRDGRTEQQITAAIDWCQDDEFWRSNILSMPKLREKYDQLRLQAGRARQKKNGRESTTDERVRAGLNLAEKYARQEQQEQRELPS